MTIDADLKALATGKNFAAMTTLMPNGQPQTQLMWVHADDDHVLINTEVGRQKFKNVTTTKDKDHFTFKMFMVPAEGEDQLAFTIEYSRRK